MVPAMTARDEMIAALAEGGIDTSLPQRAVHLLMRAELDALICSGARRGKQATYALFDERVPPGDGGIALGQAVVAAAKARSL